MSFQLQGATEGSHVGVKISARASPYGGTQDSLAGAHKIMHERVRSASSNRAQQDSLAGAHKSCMCVHGLIQLQGTAWHLQKEWAASLAGKHQDKDCSSTCCMLAAKAWEPSEAPP